MARLSEEKREQIKALLIAGTKSYRAIAREVGVSDATVRAIAKELNIQPVTDNTTVTPEAQLALTAQNYAGAQNCAVTQGAQQPTINDLVIAEHLKNKLEFVKRAWEGIFKAQELANQKITAAMVASEKFEPLLKELIELLKQHNLGAKDVKDILMMFGSLMNIPLKDISTFIGTIYDKMALASGEPTEHQRQEVQGQVSHTIDLSALSDEELDFLEQVVAKASNIGGDKKGESPPKVN